MTKYPASISGLDQEEAERIYKSLLESRNSLKSNNARISKFSSRVNDNVTCLVVEASVAFQAMAEKAMVRSHPSVTAAVKAFESLMHAQWADGDTPIKFPTDWNFDQQHDEGAGDADMLLNSSLCQTFDDTPPWNEIKLSGEQVRQFFLEAGVALRRLKEAGGFVPKRVALKGDELSNIGMAILDIAQTMNFARHMLRRDLRASAYRQIEDDLYALAFAPPCDERSNFDIAVFGDVDAF